MVNKKLILTINTGDRHDSVTSKAFQTVLKFLNKKLVDVKRSISYISQLSKRR